MFQPISFNVIRQALQWHGIPAPMLRQLSFDDSNRDFVRAEYLASWTTHQVHMVVGFATGNAEMFVRHAMYNKLRGCFCEDIEVGETDYAPFKGFFSATLYVRVSRAVIEMANWRDAVNA